MNVRFSRTIDRVVGTPLCWILNILTWSVGVVLRRRHAPPYAPERILVIKLMGVGSIVQALPLLDGLVRRYPGAELRMLCFPETEIFAKRLHPVAAVFTIDNRSLFTLARTSLTALVAIVRFFNWASKNTRRCCASVSASCKVRRRSSSTWRLAISAARGGSMSSTTTVIRPSFLPSEMRTYLVFRFERRV